MSKHSYQQSLHSLKTAIQDTPVDKPQSKEVLGEIQTHVLAVLDHPGEVPFIYHFNLLNSLQKNVAHFEADHPSLTSAISNVINTLSNMGI